jgi:hypothetical protein
MKKILFFTVAVGILGIPICFGRELFPVWEEFAQKYAPPRDVIELLEQHKELVLQLQNRGALKEIPGFFIKLADFCGQSKLMHRVVNAERLRRCLAHHNLHALEVVKKYVYKVDGIWVLRDKCLVRLDGKWIVLAEKVDFNLQKLNVSLQEVQQLTFLVEKTLYRDWGFARSVGGGPLYGGNNWVRNPKNGKLICIDTEDRSFEMGDGQDLAKFPLSFVLGFLSDAISERCDSRFKTRRWLRKRIKKIKKSTREVNSVLSLNHSRLYDPSDMNFEEVKKQWALELREFTLEQDRLRHAGPVISQ